MKVTKVKQIVRKLKRICPFPSFLHQPWAKARKRLTRQKELTMKFSSLSNNTRARFARASWMLVFAAAIAIGLAACGGGGSGGGTTPPPPPPPPVATGSLTAPAPSCVVQQDLKVCSVALTAVTANATAVTLKDSKGTSYVVAMNTTVSVPVNVPVGSETFTLSFGGATNPSVKLSATCVPGTTVDANGDCKAPVVDTYWNPPPSFTPPGVKVFGANQLPAGCNSASEQCWKDTVADDTVKFVSTAADAGKGRPIVFAYFRNTTAQFGIIGLWNVLPVYADDGSLFGADIFGGTDSKIDMVYGNAEGVIYEVAGVCRQIFWNGKNWTDKAATCPA